MSKQATIKSGAKYQTATGGYAIRNGIKAHSPTNLAGTPQISAGKGTRPPKPPWLRVRVPSGEGVTRLRTLLREADLYTVCEESHCPNMAECWTHGTATIMLLGGVCTRACRFCAVDTGNPNGWVDAKEPDNAARTVSLMNLKYVVLTSVDRDDLPDGGAAHYAACVSRIIERCPGVNVEALTPDFAGSVESVHKVVESGVHVFAQNLETVRRLTHEVRDPRAGYEQTLQVLAAAKRLSGNLLTKTSLMLGLGERKDEVLEAMRDVRARGVDILTLGQYLQPTRFHLPVARWVTPEEFGEFRQIGLSLGFREVASGPLVRSSYRADRVFEGNNLGLGEAPTDRIDIANLS